MLAIRGRSRRDAREVTVAQAVCSEGRIFLNLSTYPEVFEEHRGAMGP